MDKKDREHKKIINDSKKWKKAGFRSNINTDEIIQSKRTKHERHTHVLKKVRKWYQAEHPGSRLFPNRSGMAWAGKVQKKDDHIKIHNPYPIPFGIPTPGEGSGGADMIGLTIINHIPVFTGIEIKTGNAKLKKNQINFKTWVESINGIYKVARECISCVGEGCPACDGEGWYWEG